MTQKRAPQRPDSILLRTALASVGLALVVSLAAAAPLGTGFTYQGVLKDDLGNPQDGSFDFVFRVFDDQVDGTQVGSDLQLSNVTVTDGLFIAELNFGTVFDGTDLWLEIEVDGTLLSPRQHLTAAPYALYAPKVADGPGSGLDADTFDGIDSTGFATSGDLSAHEGDTNNPHMVTVDQITPTTTKGELMVETGAGVVPLPVGSDGAMLAANSATANGVAWTVAPTALWSTFGQTISGSNSSQGLRVDNTAGHGVYGRSTSSSDYGIYGSATGSSGRGVYGTASNTSASGVYGNASSNADYGVYGTASNTTWSRGVQGISGGSGSNCVGVFGSSTNGRGGYFKTGNSTHYGLYAESNGASSTGNAMYAFGNVDASGTKSFVQKHPGDPTKRVVYACLEGGEAGTYIRGTGQLVDGKATVTLPSHFSLVTNENEGLTVTVTPLGNCNGLYVESYGTSELVVRELQNGSSDVAFSYLLMGLRKGYESFRVIRSEEEFPQPSEEHPR